MCRNVGPRLSRAHGMDYTCPGATTFARVQEVLDAIAGRLLCCESMCIFT